MGNVVRISRHEDYHRAQSTSPDPSSTNRTKPRRASASITQMRPVFDLTAELTYNRDRYTGPEWIAAKMPGYMRTCIERICAAVARSSSKPGNAPVVAACSLNGLSIIREHREVVATLALREQFMTSDQIDEDQEDELASFLRQFPFTPPDPTTTVARRLTYPIPQYIKSQLNEMSGELGISMSALVVVCLSITMADQPAILESRRGHLAGAVAKFFERVATRREMAEVWLRRMEK